MLISVQQFRQQHFAPGSAPHESTIRRLIRKRVLPGRRIGHLYFIDDQAPLSRLDAIVARAAGRVRRPS